MNKISISMVFLLSLALPLLAQNHRDFTPKYQDSVFVSSDMAGFLGRLDQTERLRLQSFPMPDGMEKPVILRSFRVFAEDAYVSVDNGSGIEIRPVPQSRYYRGAIEGEENSLVFLRVSPDGAMKSMIRTGGEMYFMASIEGALDMLQVEPASELAMKQAGREFNCEPLEAPRQKKATAERTIDIQKAISADGFTGYVAIDTDYELYQAFGSVSGMTTYIGDLFGVINTIYNRDVDVQLEIASVASYTASNDPWKASDTSGALREFERYWKRNNSGVDRTVAHQLSGRSLGGGIAYVGAICNDEYGYGVSQLNGQYDIPTFDTWDIVVVAHELGHNFGSSHTHDYNPPIDTCTSGNLPPGGGTIMSYCHLLTGGMSNVNLEFHSRVQDVITSTINAEGSCMDGWGGGSGGPTVTDTITDTVAGNQSNYHTISVADGVIELSLTWQGGGDLDLYLLDPNNNQVASSATLNKPEVITFSTGGNSGDYTIQVLNYRSQAKGYTLTATYEN